MTDREKVIEDVKQAIKILGNVDEPTFWLDFVRVAVERALELLKEQEPRVLTLEEVMALPNGEETNAPVVREQKVPVETWDRGTVCQWCGARFVQETAEDNWYYGVEDYGKTWRVWTALPTKEQRNEVKWDEN